MIFNLSQNVFSALAEMKYELTPSITAKCRLLTSKVNFVVTIAFCYALCATYFITQRAEAHLLGATQRALLYEDGNSEIQKIRNLGNKTIKKINLCAAIADCVSALCVESSALQCQCVETIKRQWQTCLTISF